jgi:hypothetical protein
MNKIELMHEQSLKTKSMTGTWLYDPLTGKETLYRGDIGNVTATGVATPPAGLNQQYLDFQNTALDQQNSWTSMQGKGGLALGVANTGLGLMNFLNSKKTAGIQRDLMKQQLASNAETMAQKRADRANINAAFNSGGQGLKI